MKYYSVWNLKSVLRISSFKSQFKHASSLVQKYKVQDQSDSSPAFFQSEGRSRKRVLFTPDLSRDKLENLDNITSIVLALNHVSWANISVPTLTVLDWNAYSLPDSFLEDLTENDIVKIAHAVKGNIPDSELYVMESRSLRRSHSPNEVCLRSMLVLLLSALNNGSKDLNIVFQKQFIMNSLHSLLIGGERTSAQKVLEKKCVIRFSENTINGNFKQRDNNDCYSMVEIENDHLHSFINYSKHKKESLSTALLLGLTFLDVAVFQNPKSISKIQRKHNNKILDCSTGQ